MRLELNQSSDSHSRDEKLLKELNKEWHGCIKFWILQKTDRG